MTKIQPLMLRSSFRAFKPLGVRLLSTYPPPGPKSCSTEQGRLRLEYLMQELNKPSNALLKVQVYEFLNKMMITINKQEAEMEQKRYAAWIPASVRQMAAFWKAGFQSDITEEGLDVMDRINLAGYSVRMTDVMLVFDYVTDIYYR